MFLLVFRGGSLAYQVAGEVLSNMGNCCEGPSTNVTSFTDDFLNTRHSETSEGLASKIEAMAPATQLFSALATPAGFGPLCGSEPLHCLSQHKAL